MTTVIKLNNKIYSLVKGASETVLDLCSFVLSSNGTVENLANEEIEDIKKEVISNYANSAYRTLTLAYKEIKDESLVFHNKELNKREIEESLILLAVIGIEDPIREGVPDAVTICQGAGINVRMVTGDNKETAIAIAKRSRIIPGDYIYNENDTVVMLGEDFRNRVEGLTPDPENPNDLIVKNKQEFAKIVKKLKVLARSSPEDKFLLVTGLRQLKEVVAVTGDGSNDAPALKKSNVGFAMHLAGTQLAQEAADIILLDDNFSSILTAIL